jgi:hypothetical protein
MMIGKTKEDQNNDRKKKDQIAFRSKLGNTSNGSLRNIKLGISERDFDLRDRDILLETG